ncbi:hypothetical protein JTB14_003295 [Gonioctena quinquepunctata]|nr:hypothetical protein JTB14_003295 [Gonioctena quinquepunctata]
MACIAWYENAWYENAWYENAWYENEWYENEWLELAWYNVKLAWYEDTSTTVNIFVDNNFQLGLLCHCIKNVIAKNVM